VVVGKILSPIYGRTEHNRLDGFVNLDLEG
jgi:hypothetical protein